MDASVAAFSAQLCDCLAGLVMGYVAAVVLAVASTVWMPVIVCAALFAPYLLWSVPSSGACFWADVGCMDTVLVSMSLSQLLLFGHCLLLVLPVGQGRGLLALLVFLCSLYDLAALFCMVVAAVG